MRKMEVTFNDISIIVDVDETARTYNLDFDGKYFLEVDRNFKPTGKALDWAGLIINIDYYSYSIKELIE